MYNPYEKVAFSPSTEGGLGDKLLHMLGVLVLCEYKNYNTIISFNMCEHHYDWGKNEYNTTLFNFEFNNVSFIDTNINKKIYMEMTQCSTSVSPYPLYIYLQNDLPFLDFNLLSQKYEIISKQIKPSIIIENDIPKGLENAYGIHLRKSDKVLLDPLLFHENTLEEFDIIISHLLKDMQTIIQTELSPSFVLVSEDIVWKEEFQKKIQFISTNFNKPVNIISIPYNETNNLVGYRSVLDMFCLSRCKKIFQGVKVSTFSTLSALIGNVPIINYAHLLNNYDKCYVHIWKSVVSINNKKCYNLEGYNFIKNSPKINYMYNLTNFIL